jgi:hypothetical protein
LGHFDGSHFGGSDWASPHWGRSSSSAGPLPCDVLAADGGMGTGPNPEGADYPFVSPSADVAGVLADLWLASSGPAPALPLRVAWLHGMDRAVNCGAPGPASSPGPHTPRHQADVVIVDGAGAVVFDSTAAYWFRGEQVSGRLRAYEWRSAAGDCFLVQHTAFPTPQAVRLLPANIAPADGRLDERCSQPVPSRLSSIRVQGSLLRLLGDCRIRGGYNVTIDRAEISSGLRGGVELVVGATPGAGEGRHPGCGARSPAVTSINGREASGNLDLSAGGCLFLRRPATVSGGEAHLVDHTLQLGNDCGPCCDCDDYVRVQRGILVEWEGHAAVAAKAAAVTDSLKGLIGRWNANKACRDSSPFSINAVSNGGRLAIGAGFCNSQPRCLSDVRLDVTFDLHAGGIGWLVQAPLATDGAGGIANAGVVATPLPTGGRLSYTWPSVPPMASVSLRCWLELSADAASVSVDLSAGGAVGGAAIAQQATRTVSAGWGS